MKEILIVDSWEGDVPDHYKAAFPNAIFTSRPALPPLRGRPHPHGLYVAYCALSQLDIDTPVTVTFVRVFDEKARPISNFDWWVGILDQHPGATINCSWGAWDRDNAATERELERAYNGGYSARVAQKLKDNNQYLFAAAGNEDSSVLNKLDLDEDIGYPWAVLGRDSDRVFVIGAVDEDNIPASFSSDGKELDACYSGVRLLLPDAWNTIETVSINGTSFASPIAAGHALAMGGPVEYKYFAYRMEGWDSTKKHPKVGWGSMVPYEVPLPVLDSPAVSMFIDFNSVKEVE